MFFFQFEEAVMAGESTGARTLRQPTTALSGAAAAAAVGREGGGIRSTARLITSPHPHYSFSLPHPPLPSITSSHPPFPSVNPYSLPFLSLSPSCILLLFGDFLGPRWISEMLQGHTWGGRGDVSRQACHCKIRNRALTVLN